MDRKTGHLAVISGFSGVGKGTVVRRLLEKYPYVLSVSATTREPRPGEQEGVSYYFVSPEKFRQMIRDGGFLEYARYVGHYYGTPKDKVLKALDEGQDVILEIESEGARKVKQQLPETILIFVLPPTMKELERRLTARGTESREKIRKRLQKAYDEEFDHARSYDFLAVNRTVDECADQIHHIIQTGEGLKPDQTDLLDRLEKERLF